MKPCLYKMGTLMILALCSCSSISNESISHMTASIQEGSALYKNNCNTCHGDINNSNISEYSKSRIQTSILTNTGGMGFLDYLTSEQIQALSDAIVEVKGPIDDTPVDSGDDQGEDSGDSENDGSSGGEDSTDNSNGGDQTDNTAGNDNSGSSGGDNTIGLEPVIALDGAAIYSQNCAHCHGSAKPTAQEGPNFINELTLTQIRFYMNRPDDLMNEVSHLSDDEIMAIIDWVLSPEASVVPRFKKMIP